MLLETILGRHGLNIESTSVPGTVLLAITPATMRMLCRMLRLGEPEPYKISGASIFKASTSSFAVVGPAIGAPVAAAVIESLGALGVRRIVGLGWCGSIHSSASIGDLVIAERALREEGVSYHYSRADVPAEASRVSVDVLLSSAAQHKKSALCGTIWTTDALFREAEAKVVAMGADGVLAVEMEASAIYVVAAHCGIDAGVLLVVSDELAQRPWRAGFFERDFRIAHQLAGQVAVTACEMWSDKLAG